MALSIPAPSCLLSSVENAVLDDSRWDEVLIAAGGHPLQSRAWGELKARHGWSVERIAFEESWGGGLAQVLFRRRGPVSLGYVPRGPLLFGDRERAFRQLTRLIDRVSRRRLAICTIVEPDTSLGLDGTYRDYGYVRGPAPFQPARTVRVPLVPDADLLAGMDGKHRYNIRLAGRRGVTVRPGTTDGDLGQFFSLLRDTSVRNAFGIHGFDYYADALRLFGEDGRLMLAEIDGQVAAAGMAVRFGTGAAYLYGASSSTVRADGAAFLLQFELMRWARDRGATSYDLWGIPTEDPDPLPPGATGMTQSRGEDHRGLFTFKTRFGGEIVRFPWPMERRYVPVAAAAARRAGILVG